MKLYDDLRRGWKVMTALYIVANGDILPAKPSADEDGEVLREIRKTLRNLLRKRYIRMVWVDLHRVKFLPTARLLNELEEAANRIQHQGRKYLIARLHERLKDVYVEEHHAEANL